jgi:hypothetical protein
VGLLVEYYNAVITLTEPILVHNGLTDVVALDVMMKVGETEGAASRLFFVMKLEVNNNHHEPYVQFVK